MKLKTVVVLVLCAVSRLHGSEAPPTQQTTAPSVQAFSSTQPYDAIINVGGDCQVAYQLAKHGLRAYALPFDALVTPYTALRDMLRQKFEGFMMPENFEFVISEKDGNHILDKKYGTWLIHDFKLQEGFLNDYDAVCAKYLRRIERLMKLIASSTYPLFIRKIITKEQALELRNLLFTLREGRPFLLLALDGTDEIKVDWQIEWVRNFYLRQKEPYTWRGDPEAWKEIFMAVDMVVHENKPVSKEARAATHVKE